MQNSLVNDKDSIKKYHTSVMLDESLDYLNIKEDGTYIDCTLGEGGHSFEIFKRLSNKGMLLSIDQDISAIEFVQKLFKDTFDKLQNSPEKYPKWELRNSNFSEINRYTRELNLKPNGILMDLGLSSRQLEQMRGFSYREENADLDMRMDKKLGVKASDLLKVLNEYELTKLFKTYGEERHAKQIAKSIKMADSITTVEELNQAIRKGVPAAIRHKGKHPSTRVFQALRIAVNDELNSLKETLKQSINILESKGRLVVISFHSLEDRIVKNLMRDAQDDNKGLIIETSSLEATESEINDNPRSRSAKIRVFEKH